MNLEQLKKMLAIKNVTASTAEFFVYGDIVDSQADAWSSEDVYPKAIQDYLDQAKGRHVNLYINSVGGSVFAGLQIYNMIKRHDGQVTVHIDGLAASIASVIALVAPIVMPKNAMLMVHKPLFGYASGNADDLRQYADTLDRVQEAMMTIYASRLRDPERLEEFEALLNKETWMTSDQVEEWFTDVTVAKPLEAVAVASKQEAQKLQHVPDNVQIVPDVEDLPIIAQASEPKGDDQMDINAIIAAVKDGTLDKKELTKALADAMGSDFRAIADAEAHSLISKLGEENATPEAIEILKLDAVAGRQYKADLIDKAIETRVRAQGEKFTEAQKERYRKSLANSADLDYVKDEIGIYEALVQESLVAGRQTFGNDDSLEDIPTSPRYKAKGDE